MKHMYVIMSVDEGKHEDINTLHKKYWVEVSRQTDLMPTNIFELMLYNNVL